MILHEIASKMCHTVITGVLIALGANLPGPYGNAETSVRAAEKQLVDMSAGAFCLSRLFRTPAFPTGSGPDFVNAAAMMEWGGAPKELLDRLQEIETALGRTRQARWEARVIDIDILAMGDLIWPDPETEARWRALPPEAAQTETPEGLILPHPRLAERAFVLGPLMDVAPNWVHPVLGRSVTELWKALPAAEKASISPILDR